MNFIIDHNEHPHVFDKTIEFLTYYIVNVTHTNNGTTTTTQGALLPGCINQDTSELRLSGATRIYDEPADVFIPIGTIETIELA